MYEKIKRDKDEQFKELEEILAEFMKNIRLENERLERKLFEGEIKGQALYENKRPRSEYEQKQNQINEAAYEQESYTLQQHKMERDIVETSVESQILQLAKEGKSVTEIAKQLNRGKTEVELLLKLNDRTR